MVQFSYLATVTYQVLNRRYSWFFCCKSTAVPGIRFWFCRSSEIDEIGELFLSYLHVYGAEMPPDSRELPNLRYSSIDFCLEVVSPNRQHDIFYGQFFFLFYPVVAVQSWAFFRKVCRFSFFFFPCFLVCSRAGFWSTLGLTNGHRLLCYPCLRAGIECRPDFLRNKAFLKISFVPSPKVRKRELAKLDENREANKDTCAHGRWGYRWG